MLNVDIFLGARDIKGNGVEQVRRQCEIDVGKDQTVVVHRLEDDKGLSWPRLLDRQGLSMRRESM